MYFQLISVLNCFVFCRNGVSKDSLTLNRKYVNCKRGLAFIHFLVSVSDSVTGQGVMLSSIYIKCFFKHFYNEPFAWGNGRPLAMS